MMKKIFITTILMFVFAHTASAKESLWQKSYNLEAAKKYQKAAAVIEPLTSRGESREYAWLRLGWLNYLQANYNDAKHAYRQALKINPQSIDACLGLVKPLLAQKRWREAQLQVKLVLKKAPLNLSANLIMMAIDEHNKDWAKLIKDAQKMLRYYPSSADSLVYLARAHAWQKNKKAAKKAYRQVLSIYPKNLEANYYLKNN